MLYRLADRLGVWDVHRLEREMSWPQFREWMEYLEITTTQEESENLSSRAERNRRRAARGSYP